MKDLQDLRALLQRSRLSINAPHARRASVVTHLGACPGRLAGTLFAHRDLLGMLAALPLQTQEAMSVAHAAGMIHGQDVGVGHVVLRTVPSGAGPGGSSVRLSESRGGLSWLYTCWLTPEAEPSPCDHLTVFAQPEWVVPENTARLSEKSLRVLTQLGAKVLVIAPDLISALDVVGLCGSSIPVRAHRSWRFIQTPGDAQDGQEHVLIWPEANAKAILHRLRSFQVVVLLSVAPKAASLVGNAIVDAGLTRKIECIELGRDRSIGTEAMASFWRRCERPIVDLQGHADWLPAARELFTDWGATCNLTAAPTQLGLAF